MEQDLDTAEDSAADANAKNKELETENEDLKREVAKLKRENDRLEGTYVTQGVQCGSHDLWCAQDTTVLCTCTKPLQ